MLAEVRDGPILKSDPRTGHTGPPSPLQVAGRTNDQGCLAEIPSLSEAESGFAAVTEAPL